MDFQQKKIYIKPNFVFQSNSLESNIQRDNYLLFVGRLSEEKGVSVLIDAYIKNHISTPLKIVGDGPLRQVLQRKVQTAGYANIVEFLGHQDKLVVMELMQKAKLLVFPSIWYEGFPLTIIEAFAASLPVIASQLGSMAEIVQDHMSGLYFEPGNSEDLAAKIKWAIDHYELMVNYGNNARLICEYKYSSEANYQQLMSIYHKFIKI
ncbi:glycosyltransferase [Nostoc piscinale]|uniref:glycosyltransferase n=1 Tax=Nostoc piscinale TaxID=224012 RepID=UPI002FF4CB7C